MGHAPTPAAQLLATKPSPDLNPAERVLEETRQRVEGRTYATVAEKRAVADAYLADLAADPERVNQLCGWDWLQRALGDLPNSSPATLTQHPYKDHAIALRLT